MPPYVFPTTGIKLQNKLKLQEKIVASLYMELSETPPGKYRPAVVAKVKRAETTLRLLRAKLGCEEESDGEEDPSAVE
jgi:hypothetical protein